MLLAASCVALAGALAVCCSFPAYEAAPSSPADGGPNDGRGLDDAGEGGGAGCGDGLARIGEVVSCGCPSDSSLLDGGTREAGPDATSNDALADGRSEIGGDAATTGGEGLRVCTPSGTFGPCVGCPRAPAGSCEAVSMLPGDMACVPSGVVPIGASNPTACPPSGCSVEQPEHVVAVSRFFLDQREVTVGAFRRWWGAKHAAPRAGEPVIIGGDGTKVVWDATWQVTEPTRADGLNDATWLGEAVATNDPLPVNYVDWPTALAFCVAQGRRLPTESEWEDAASGHAARLFPREAPNTRREAAKAAMLPCTRALSSVTGGRCEWPRGNASDGFSVDGVYDLAGSLAEWVLDSAPPGGTGCRSGCYPAGPVVDPVAVLSAMPTTTPLRPIRGGSFADNDPNTLRAQARAFVDASTRAATIGFRCARR